MSTVAHHFPPDVLNLLADTIPLLNRSKPALLYFFENAGVPEYVLGEHRDLLEEDKDRFSKWPVTRQILTELNRRQDACIKARREILKRVCEFENFSSCWDDDRDSAKLKVFELRALIDGKDSVTKLARAADEARAEKMKSAKEIAEKKAVLFAERERLSKEIGALFSIKDGPARGKALEPVLNDIFKFAGIAVSEAFTRRSEENQVVEQVDGVIQLDGHLYLVEMKWHMQPIGVDLMSPHLVRVFNRGDVRGLVISASWYTRPAIDLVNEALGKIVFVLMDLSEIVMALEKAVDLKEVLRQRVNLSIMHRDASYRPVT